jgi:hypothetical protein
MAPDERQIKNSTGGIVQEAHNNRIRVDCTTWADAAYMCMRCGSLLSAGQGPVCPHCYQSQTSTILGGKYWMIDGVMRKPVAQCAGSMQRNYTVTAIICVAPITG